MFVITGATGNVGGSAAHALLAQGKDVKVIGRNAEKLSAFAGTKAVLAEGDILDSAFLTEQFRGASAVLIVVPSNIQAANVRAHQREIIASYMTALRTAEVKNIVAISSVGAHLPEGTGPVTGLYDLEQELATLTGANVLVLRPAFFLQNLYSWLGMIQHANITGMAIAATVAQPMIHTTDIGNYSAQRLGAGDYTGHSVQYLLGSRDYTMQEAATVLGTAIGKPELPYVQFPYDQFAGALMGNGFGESMAQSYVEMSIGINGGAFHADATRTPESTTPTSLEDFAQEFAGAYRAMQA